MIDFDAKFQAYYEAWLKENAGKFTYDELESKVAEIYEEWIETADSDLDGKSPAQWIDGMSEAELFNIFLESFDSSVPSEIVTDRISALPDCKGKLENVLLGDYKDEVKIFVANMLIEVGCDEKCLNIFAEWLCDDGYSAELREVAVEVLVEYADKIKEKIFAAIDGADLDRKTLFAEILINTEKDDRTFGLLEDLFRNGNNRALYAGYIGKYGDERFAGMLYKALDDCNYLEFTEIRNAIEMLGGVVDDDYRDFSDDEYYKAIKNLR